MHQFQSGVAKLADRPYPTTLILEDLLTRQNAIAKLGIEEIWSKLPLG
ncbi:hypothetical protein AB3R30_00225 [Leptolyngbyaceae cyanobacterium UHCC 1019]